MDSQTKPRIPSPPDPNDPEQVREWNDYLRSIGITPATGPWRPIDFEPINPSFYLLRRWVIWPVRTFIDRRFR